MRKKKDVNHTKSPEYRVMKRAERPQYYIEYREAGDKEWEDAPTLTNCYGIKYFYTYEEALERAKHGFYQDKMDSTEPEVVWTSSEENKD